jgi:NAD(P)-dependent dehydrogenase (short-subunit alcohol dehydrogenase family)
MDGERTVTDFEGLVAVVTGGASGIGLATAEPLASRGASVAVLDLKSDDLPGELTGFRADVSSNDEVTAAIDAVIERFSRLDIVVNSAGIGAQGDVSANDDDEWHRVLDINVVAVARVSRAALPHLRKSASAAIVNACSIAAWTGLPARTLYSASKGAVLSLTLAMAADQACRCSRWLPSGRPTRPLPDWKACTTPIPT